MARKHSPGGIYISPGLGMFIIIVLLGIFGLLFMSHLNGPPVVTLSAPPTPAPRAPVETTIIQESGDDRYTRAPKPERDWRATPDLSEARNSPYNLPTYATRGLPETYQSMGIITVGDGKVLPLYGRRTSSRSDRFQYYTRTDSYNPVQLPVRYKNRDCEDVNGCEELFDGDRVNITGNGESGPVKIYRFSGPTYIPVV
jgi:Family of unknown function (DUF5755)